MHKGIEMQQKEARKLVIKTHGDKVERFSFILEVNGIWSIRFFFVFLNSEF